MKACGVGADSISSEIVKQSEVQFADTATPRMTRELT